MTLNSEPADPTQRAQHGLEPKSFAEAVEEALERDDDNYPLDESIIKESPPQLHHTRSTSEARPLGEVIDEIERSPAPGSPVLRHPRGRLENKKSHDSHIDTADKSSAMSNGSFDGHQHDQHNGLSLSSRQDKIEPSEQEDSEGRPQLSRQLSLVSGRKAGAGWASSAIRWAPLNVPVQRRLQTLVVLLHTISIVGMLGIFFFICAIPLSWPLVVPYLIYLTFSRAAVDGKLAHRSEWLRSSKLWSLFGAYFPARLHRSQELEPTRKYIFGYHPHGIISHGAFAAFATEALGFGQLFPGITNTLLTLDANFSIPLYRDWALRLGLASVSRESCENLLSKGGINGAGMGRAITIVIGGARESLDASPKSMKLVLKRRKGFVKLAIRTGADLVPVLSFGENDLYDQLDGKSHPFVHRLQLVVKKFMGFTVPLFHARGVFNYDVGIMPYRRPVNIVVGKPIRVRQAAQPDPAYVDELHAKYVDELVGIWEAWKDDFAPNRESELELAE
ncbi:diacylglycerol O-acyltransferase 2A [Dissoconium aciculare CBS 342.82]|uniref:diacylglycerol O-acyltransferase n=1 Tax=Dissoconium aciculare CBS 342.82 TaxID=1314786 RepID=A0A6J3MA88_9PEZI|nr:diacylglycerol O-acyltransferase 2A [Dissoconium aciculare CBS 342.82]KAF1824549.1 diacylglycerol O-acyltransferase 2A [Dissoconium aciculare CBS 342.82]